MSFVQTQYYITSDKLHAPVTIVHLSDLHDAKYGERQCLLLNAVKGAKPDMIVCTGDLLNRKDVSAFQNAFDLIEGLVPIAPVFVVEGNHEACLNETGERYLESIRQRGAVLLRNASVHAYGMQIVGLKQRAEETVLESLMEPNLFHLVLCHRPEYFPKYCHTSADLILCGHAHGGQVRIFGRALIAPNQGLFPRYVHGLYQKNGMKMIVSSGLGDANHLPRFGNPHEIGIIHMEPAL